MELLHILIISPPFFKEIFKISISYNHCTPLDFGKVGEMIPWNMVIINYNYDFLFHI